MSISRGHGSSAPAEGLGIAYQDKMKATTAIRGQVAQMLWSCWKYLSQQPLPASLSLLSPSSYLSKSSPSSYLSKLLLTAFSTSLSLLGTQMQEAARAQLPGSQLVFSPPAHFLLPLPAQPCSCAHSAVEGILQRTARITHFEHFILLENHLRM